MPTPPTEKLLGDCSWYELRNREVYVQHRGERRLVHNVMCQTVGAAIMTLELRDGVGLDHINVSLDIIVELV